MTDYYAIRWDVGAYDTTPSSVAELNTLRQPEFHGRAPWYATVQDTNSLAITSTQATMNQEIAFANAAGITGWAFLRYINISSPTLGGDAVTRFQASGVKGPLKYVSMEQNGTLGTTATYHTGGLANRLRNEMLQSYYGTVSVGAVTRPLMFYLYDPATLAANYTNLAGLKTVLDYVRAGCIAVGLNTPYIVLLYFDVSGGPDDVATIATALGADAIGNYLPFRPYNYNGTYQDVRDAAVAYWAAQRTRAIAGSHGLVPTAMTGWNPAPRLQMPVPWEASIGQRSWVGHKKVFAFPTDAELAAHIGQVKSFIAANPTECEANTALIYAWNEHGEAGRVLCPSRENPTGTWLDDVAAAL